MGIDYYYKEGEFPERGTLLFYNNSLCPFTLRTCVLGRRNSIGRVSDCGSVCCKFKSYRLPFLTKFYLPLHNNKYPVYYIMTYTIIKQLFNY